MANEIEVLEQRPLVDTSVVETVTRAEIEQLVRIARDYPRSLKIVMDGMMELACRDEESALDCIYTLPRDGKKITGPSIRFAEMIACAWGNCRIAARTTMIDRVEKFVEAEGFFLDAQTNVAQVSRIRRRISGKGGRLYSDDMIMVTANAAQSIARRNAILAGIPKMAWRPALNRAIAIIRGSADTLVARRTQALEAFSKFDLDVPQILTIMDVKGVEDIGLDDLVHLRGLYASLLNADVTAAELLRAAEPETERVTAKTANLDAAPEIFGDDDGGLPTPEKKTDLPTPNSKKKEPGKAPEASALPYRVRRRR